MTDRTTPCTDCGAPGDPHARFCARCGRPTTTSTAPAPALPRRRRPAPLVVGFTVLLAGLALVTVLDRGDAPAPPDRADRATDEPGAVAPRDEVDVGDGPTDDAIEPIAGLVCQGPGGPTACVRHVADVDLASADEVRVIRGRIVVAGEDGSVSVHSLRDGSRRWRADFDGPVTLHPDVAESLPVSSAGGLDVLDLDSGRRIGRVEVDARQVATIGPWIVVDDGERVGAYGVTGRPGWTRSLDGGTALLSDTGSYVRREGSLEALFANTGGQRFDTAITGAVRAITQQDGRVMAVTDEPPEVRSIGLDGTTRSRTSLPGTRLAWAAFTPDGGRLVALTEDDDGNLQWLSILNRFQPDSPLHLAVFGRRSTLDPVLDDRLLLVPTVDGRTDLLVIDLDRRAVVNRVTTDRPLTDISPAGDAGFATIDDLGTLRVQGVRDPAPAYRVALGSGAQLLQARPLLVRTQRAIVAFDDVPPS